MRLRIISEEKDAFFTYTEMAKDMWRNKVREAQKTFNINFDLENDSDVTRREIIIDQDQWEHTKCKFKCELRAAGGDWQIPVMYFRCQIVAGYAKGVSTYGLGGPYLVFIPGKEQGNPHLVKTKNGWSAPDDNSKKKEEQTNGNEFQAWKALKEYLKELVDDEIKEVRKNG
jgi:hypothetical protein